MACHLSLARRNRNQGVDKDESMESKFLELIMLWVSYFSFSIVVLDRVKQADLLRG